MEREHRAQFHAPPRDIPQIRNRCGFGYPPFGPLRHCGSKHPKRTREALFERAKKGEKITKEKVKQATKLTRVEDLPPRKLSYLKQFDADQEQLRAKRAGPEELKVTPSPTSESATITHPRASNEALQTIIDEHQETIHDQESTIDELKTTITNFQNPPEPLLERMKEMFLMLAVHEQGEFLVWAKCQNGAAAPKATKKILSAERKAQMRAYSAKRTQ